MPPKKDSGAKATLAKKSLATFKQHSENKIKEVQGTFFEGKPHLTKNSTMKRL